MFKKIYFENPMYLSCVHPAHTHHGACVEELGLSSMWALRLVASTRSLTWKTFFKRKWEVMYFKKCYKN